MRTQQGFFPLYEGMLFVLLFSGRARQSCACDVSHSLRVYTFFEIQQLQAQVRAFARGRQQRPPRTSPAPAMDTRQPERLSMQLRAFCTSAPLSFIRSYPVSELLAKSGLVSWLLRSFSAKLSVSTASTWLLKQGGCMMVEPARALLKHEQLRILTPTAKEVASA